MATVAVAPARVKRERSAPSWLGGLIGIVGVLVIWQIVGLTIFSENRLVPPPTHIIAKMQSDGWQFYWNNVRTTMHEAILGWAWGNALAIFCAFLFLVLPFLERPLMRLAVASFCLPIIAIGPILQITFNGQSPKIILAALSVFFTTLVGALVGLRSADKTTLDLIHAYGGGSVKKLTKVRLRASLPSLFAALRIAAPAAVLGAIIGEYMGGESGLGIAMIAAQTAYEMERTWAIALTATALAAIGYGLTALVGNLLTPWAPKSGRR